MCLFLESVILLEMFSKHALESKTENYVIEATVGLFQEIHGCLCIEHTADAYLGIESISRAGSDRVLAKNARSH